MKGVLLFIIFLVAVCYAQKSVDERLEALEKNTKWLESVVVMIQKLEGIPGDIGMPGLPGKCDDSILVPMRIELIKLRRGVNRSDEFRWRISIAIGLIFAVTMFKYFF